MQHAPCFHCQLPVVPTAGFSAVIAGQAQRFCCAGCAAIAELISRSGLEGYYRHRDAPAVRPDEEDIGAEDAARYAIFNEPDARSGFVVQGEDGSLRAELAIDGINCAACTWLIEHHLARQPGVRSATVSLAEQRASVRWASEQTSLAAIMLAIHRIGYRPRPWQPSAHLESLKRDARAALRRLGVAGLVQMQIGMFAIGLYAGAFQGIEDNYRDLLRWASLVLCVPVVFYSAVPFFRGAWRGVRNGAPGMDLPVAIAIALAFAASLWFTLTGGAHVYFDSVAMFTFFLLLGRYLEMQARHRAGLANGHLLSLVPSAATRLIEGRHELVPVARLRVNDGILVRPGEAFAADGRVVAGESSADEASLSGESLPVAKAPGSVVSAGTVNLDGALTVQVEATGLQSRLGNILALVDRAAQERPRLATMADRAATRFVLVVLTLAAGSGVVWWQLAPDRALEIVLAVLVVSCPCALSLATPTALTAATSALKQRGFLVTRGHALDTLAVADVVVFDKTGTLTTGALRLDAVRPIDPLGNAEALQRIAAALESRSSHPIAAAFCEAGDHYPDVEGFRSVAGRGLEGRVEGVVYRIGRADFVCIGFDAPTAPDAGRWLLLGDAQRALCWFRVSDSLREESVQTVRALQAAGFEVALLSGDVVSEVAAAAQALGISDWRADCSPEDKLADVRARQQRGDVVVMVGDGINDVPVLSGANVSIALSNASDITRANADCMVLADDLGRVPEALRLARRTRAVVRQNMLWAIAYNLSAIPFAAAGLVPPWLAAIGMSASSLVVVGNALRLRRDQARS